MSMDTGKDVNAMTLDQCCRELAERMPDCSGCTDPRSDGTHQMGTKQHHIPPTLDAIAAAMPEGWTVEITIGPNIPAQAWASRSDRAEVIRADADTELLARARLAVACWRASHPTPPPAQERR